MQLKTLNEFLEKLTFFNVYKILKNVYSLFNGNFLSSNQDKDQLIETERKNTPIFGS